jgi:hypothetical protein
MGTAVGAASGGARRLDNRGHFFNKKIKIIKY